MRYDGRLGDFRSQTGYMILPSCRFPYGFKIVSKSWAISRGGLGGGPTRVMDLLSNGSGPKGHGTHSSVFMG